MTETRRPPVPDASQGRVAALTGVRAIAAIAVVLYHARLQAGTYGLALPPWLARTLGAGYLGVDLFFILSGFILSRQYIHAFPRLRPRPMARFLALRLARIHPLQVATLLLVAGVVLAGWLGNGEPPDPARHGARSFVAHLLLVHAWGWSTTLTWNSPAWSISCEWLAYLFFPLIARGLARRRGTGAAAVLAVALVGLSVIALRLCGKTSLDATSDGGVLRIAGEFTAGCLLFLWCRDAAAGPRVGAWLAWASLAALAALAPLGAADPWSAFLFLALLAGLARGGGAPGRLLSTRFACWLGEVSYAVYMVHLMVIVALARAVPQAWIAAQPVPVRAGLFLAQVPAVVACAAVAHLVVEKPAREWLRSRIDRRWPAQREAVDPSAAA